MKLSLAIILTYLVFTICTLSAPIPLELPQASLTDSVRSFESEFSQLEDKMQSVAEKHKAFGVREKWLTGAAAGLTMLGTSGYIVSSAIPEAKRQQQAATLRKLKAAVARANERAAAAAAAGGIVSANTGTSQASRMRVKRSTARLLEQAAETLERHKEEDAESFRSALSRTPSSLSASQTPSMRIGDFEDDIQHARVSPPWKLTKSQSLPVAALSPLKTQSQTAHDRLMQDNLDTELRISALESALLDVRKHQHNDQVSKLSPYTKGMIGFAVLNAAGGVVSAELSVQGAIESSRATGPLPDVANLDARTCAEYAKTVGGLDCDAAHGKV
ncbi:hypothetical protein EX895_001016 [Sporisorium graminicola]|uniref:Uncharacterized protein n=1 Tax=Sporisorium graminicola TaxID=280036 RepID=A0A4U7L2P0_9BASI|nr:hypothetical protein EX895_001016 [Sporisorium graminicola]TKY91017.1 hypothetical protein EX895_001016 [Sporisorium graminicola]